MWIQQFINFIQTNSNTFAERRRGSDAGSEFAILLKPTWKHKFVQMHFRHQFIMKSAGIVHELWMLSNRIESNKVCTIRNFWYIIHWLTYIKSAAFDKISLNMTFVWQFECCLNSQHLSIVCPCANNRELFGFELLKTWFIPNTNTIAGLFGFFMVKSRFYVLSLITTFDWLISHFWSSYSSILRSFMWWWTHLQPS